MLMVRVITDTSIVTMIIDINQIKLFTFKTSSVLASQDSNQPRFRGDGGEWALAPSLHGRTWRDRVAGGGRRSAGGKGAASGGGGGGGTGGAPRQGGPITRAPNYRANGARRTTQP